jgi:hypothetical protein
MMRVIATLQNSPVKRHVTGQTILVTLPTRKHLTLTVNSPQQGIALYIIAMAWRCTLH